MKSIRLVPRSLILATLLVISSIGLSGCASTAVKPIEVRTVQEERLPLNLPDPNPVKAPSGLAWVVITPENFEAVMAELKASGQPLVLFSVTPDGYERLSLTMLEIRNYILSQRSIILQYKNYYEGPLAPKK